jgi:hypothetical protein
MAGSSTENMDNFGTQAVERHQMIMNTDVMKHITVMNRTSVREIMLEHEKTFKEQVSFKFITFVVFSCQSLRGVAQ